MDQKVNLKPLDALELIKENLNIRVRYDNFIGGDWVAPADEQNSKKIKAPKQGPKL